MQSNPGCNSGIPVQVQNHEPSIYGGKLSLVEKQVSLIAGSAFLLIAAYKMASGNKLFKAKVIMPGIAGFALLSSAHTGSRTPLVLLSISALCLLGNEIAAAVADGRAYIDLRIDLNRLLHQVIEFLRPPVATAVPVSY